MGTKRKLFFLAIIFLSLSLVNCGKDGAVGPQGNTGDKGATGAQGLVGPAGPKGANGKDGSKMYTGTTVPLVTTGTIGDFYVNTSTGFLYGPKAANGWGTGYSLKGPAGATGAAGSKTLSGAGVPGAALGSNGDFYLDKSSYLLYGPKTSAGWGVGLNLRGPVGTANVIYSDWVNILSWKTSIIFDTYHFYYDIAASKITQAILDKGAVIVYGKLNGYNPTIWPTDNVAVMPILISYKNISSGPINTDIWSAITSLNNIRIDFVNDQNYYTSIANNHLFRYVIIPGGVHTTGSHHIDFSNYMEVKRVFHLID